MLTPRTRCPRQLRSSVRSSFLFLFSVGKFSVNMSGDCTKYMFWQPWQLDGTSYQPLASFLGHYACLSFSHPSILVLLCKNKKHTKNMQNRGKWWINTTLTYFATTSRVSVCFICIVTQMKWWINLFITPVLNKTPPPFSSTPLCPVPSHLQIVVKSSFHQTNCYCSSPSISIFTFLHQIKDKVIDYWLVLLLLLASSCWCFS